MKFHKIGFSRMIFASVGVVLTVAANVQAMPGSGKELAKVNNTVITDQDLTAALGSLNEGQRENILSDVTTRGRILSSLVDQEILVQEAEKSKMDQEPEFKNQLNTLKRNLMVSLLIKKKFSSQLTPSAVKKYYETHKENFATDLAHVQHILVSDENEAKKIFKMAQNPQNDFQELAENYSKDPTAKNNRGDLGLVGHGRLAPEFLNAVFATAPGAVTGPIHTTFGYHVIKVVSKKVGRPMEFEEVKLQVQTALEQELMRQYITSLKGQTKVQVNRAAVEKN